MGESNTDIPHSLSRRNFISGRWFGQSTNEGENSRVVSIDVRDFTDIESRGDLITLNVDKVGFQDYVNRKLIKPIAGDFPALWSYVFDVKPRPVPGSSAEDYLKQVKGLSVLSSYATTLINVPRIWEVLPVWDKTENKLIEEICRTVAHETFHVAQYSNLIAREQAITDSRFRKDWYQGGKILSHVAGLGGGARVQDLLDKEKISGKMSRRKFLKLTGAASIGLLLGNLVSEEVGWDALSFFDQQIDSSHKLCYQEGENNWKEVKNLITVDKIIGK